MAADIAPTPNSNGDGTEAAARIENVGAALSVAYLTSLDDTAFIKCAYQTLFKRPVDASSQQFYLARLQQGISKQQVLIELRASTEGQRCNVDIDGLNQITMRPAVSAAQLLLLADEQFVRSVFLTLFQREPDADGGGYYLKRLRSGVSKSEILAELADSDEGRSKAVELPGLAEIVRRYRRYKLPIIGAAIRKWFAPQEASLVHAKLRALENRLAAMDDRVRAQAKYLEPALVEIDARLRSQETQREDFRARLNAVGTMPSKKKQRQEHEPDSQELRSARRESMLRLTTRGKEIHREIGRSVEARKNDKRIENANRD